MTRLEITNQLIDQPVDALWVSLLAQVRTLQPFWSGAVQTFGERSSFPSQTLDEYLATIDGAFDKMDGWRNGSLKYFKVRRHEVDKVISFLRNKAIERSNCSLRIAPVARNAAKALRACLTISTHGYHDSQIPELAASIVYDLAAVRTLFPFDFSNLTCFHPGHDAPHGSDPFVIRLQRASVAIGIEDSFERLLEESERILREFGSPSPMEFPEAYWTEPGDGADARLYHASIAAFHQQR